MSVIQIVSVTAQAVCRNCRTVIRRGRGDLDRNEHWWHDKNGLPTCPDAPGADPDRASIQETP